MQKSDEQTVRPSHRKRNALVAILLLGVTLSSGIFVGGYMATGNWLPWGNRHYYEKLNVNFGYCVSGSQNFCSSVHNTMFNTGVAWMDEITQKTTGTVTNGCFPSATCGMSFISLSNSAVTFAAADSTFGATNGNCAAQEGGSELNANGEARAAATTNTILSGATGGTSTLVKTFTDTTASQGVQDACLVSSGTISSANNIELAAASFTAVTLQIGDTIQITWTLTWTWS